MRFLLLACLLLVVAGTAASSLFIIRGYLRGHVRARFEEDLQHSVETFQDLETSRLAALHRENALMAALPSLKALMTSNDPRTITDDAVDFWKTSGNDLFALADADSHIMAAEAKDFNEVQRSQLKKDLQAVLHDPQKHYLITSGNLFEYSVNPLYFGSEANGTLLGYVISGFKIDHPFLREVGRGAGAEAAFSAANTILVSTMPRQKEASLATAMAPLKSIGMASVTVDGEQFLIARKDISSDSASALKLVVMKSFNEPDRTEREINWLVFLVSLLVFAAGSVLTLLLARMVTRPLELLASGVRAFGEGDRQHSLPHGGTQEVRYLGRVFAEMRDEIQKTNRALLESERLATIGRMASSVSHDLRHYLAAVYANAEFLSSPTLPATERAELFDEIRIAVNGTTDMLDSLLVFSRTGNALQRIPTAMAILVERTISLVRTHPDADTVNINLTYGTEDTTAAIDSKQIERAIYNLLLNACQSARERGKPRETQSGIKGEVQVSLASDQRSVSITISDNGPGVPEGIRDSLFDPFVSLGKQRGTGLGLTLASSVAREHGGDVKLLSSRAGKTTFRLTVARYLPAAMDELTPPEMKVLTS